MTLFQILAGLAALISFRFCYLWYKTVAPNNLKELPGPKGYPLVGNFFDMPREKAYLKFKEWADTYGPIFKLEIFGSTHVIVSSQEIAEDLMAKRGAIYSDRGTLHMIKLVTGGRDLLASSSESDYWRLGRRFAASMLTPTMAAQWEPYQRFQCMRMVDSMLREPERYIYWFDRYATLVSLKEIYGKDIATPEEEEYHTRTISERMHNIERLGTPGGYLVELIPALMKLPAWMAPFRAEAQALRDVELAYFDGLLQESEQRWNIKGQETPESFARCWLKKDNRWELNATDITYVLGTLYGGGSGTTSNAMQTFIMAMALYPEWQMKLHEEIDAVVGPDRLPSFSDRPQLKLVRAVCKEILRWRPVVPGNLPHRLTRADEYDGYHIPEGSFVHGNQWAIHREDSQYPDGETFEPSRYLKKTWPSYKEPLEIHPNIKRFSAFGFGRRICPGLETADRSLIIQIATLAWACDISQKTGPDGQALPIDDFNYTEGSNVMPKPFHFELKPRSAARSQLIAEAAQGSS